MAFDDRQASDLFAVGRMVNLQNAAEGGLLPPEQIGEFRVPFVTNLRLIKRESFAGQTRFTVAWDDASTEIAQIDHYNLYVIGLGSAQPVGPQTAKTSPGIVTVASDTIRHVTILVQTQLKNGLVSELSRSPSIAGVTIASATGAALAVPSGGTGATSLLNHAVLLGAGTSPINTVAVGSTNNVLHGNTGADPTWSQVALTSDVVGVLPIVNGGTNSTSALTNGKIMVASSSMIVEGPAGTTTTVLHGNAAGLPSYSGVALGADVVGVLPIANGGTFNSAAYSTGSLIFSNGVRLTEDNASLYFDDTNNRLGLLTTAPKSTLHDAGSVGLKIKSIVLADSPYLAATEVVLLADAVSGNMTVNLPTASGVVDRFYMVKKTDTSSNTVFVVPASVDLIETSASYVLNTSYQAIRFGCTGSAWWLV